MKVLVVVLAAVVVVAASAPQYVYNYAFNIPSADISDPKPVNTGFQAPAAYVSPFGVPLFSPYYSQPQIGYIANVNTAQVPETQPHFSALSPLLKQASDNRMIVFERQASPGVLQYSVSQDFSERAESVSSLAAKLNAIPVAAVHDVQAPPRFRQGDDATDPVLSFREEDGVTKYRLEIPTQ
ncbi:uncharacterized protein LOC125043166 [Penaeus chinensis]|uniref:uncharacterized protein LOC125043166 n=1 Tax=Penaeus chinensis TaxID=139456 RepID=UPI001FB67FE8|nr:uncharacterized protein LOC125043166 [Penaeus chinensis]